MMDNLENSGKEPSPFSNNFGNPFTSGGMMSPFGNTKPNESPFNSNPMFNKPMSSLSDMDIDQMMKDIDRRLKELDEEEERQKAEMEKANSTVKPMEQVIKTPKVETQVETLPETINSKNNTSEVNIEKLPREAKTDVGKQGVASANKENKPKINVDADSIIVNDSGITDDEFFDDFFNE